MSGHWADRYVGLPAQGKRPCWQLVRQVWIDRLGFEMPSFEDERDSERAVAIGSQTFTAVPRGQEKELDAVMVYVPMRDKSSPAGFRNAETHVGVIVAPGLVLHVEQDRTAVIEPIKRLKVSRILRGPWGAA
jgi:hypothetical protein